MGFDRMFSSNKSDTPNYPIILMDGGLGTTLEDTFHKNILHPLWSAQLVDEDEETIVAAHIAFLRAGSQVILTSTYQAAYETFRRAKYTDTNAERLMRKSVSLAAVACKKHEREIAYEHMKASSHPRTHVALSLGPYGATLETAAEFTGKYPPPYGPSSQGATRGPVSASEERSNEDALAAFHFSRLLVYASDSATWESIDLVAFETVPLVTEARAIRRAVARLEDWFHQSSQGHRRQSKEMKPWYISFVFSGPHGEFPQYRYKQDLSERLNRLIEVHPTLDDQRPFTPREIVQATCSRQDDIYPKMARPDAIGINCTKIADVLRVTDEFTEAMRHLLATSPASFDDKMPWLAVSPNGGVTYNITERTWIDPGLDPQVQDVSSSEKWALSVKQILPTQGQGQLPKWSGVFNGLLLGGCCKTGPNNIRALREVLSKYTHENRSHQPQ